MIIIMIYWHPCPNNVKFWARSASTGNRVPTRIGKHADASTRTCRPSGHWVPSLGRHVTLTVSVKGMKTIDRIGIEAALARIRRNTPARLELTKFDPSYASGSHSARPAESVPTARTNRGRPSVISAHSHHQGASMQRPARSTSNCNASRSSPNTRSDGHSAKGTRSTRT